MANYMMDLRRMVGKRPLLQVGASVICLNTKGDILLQKRRDNNCWCYPGGSVELDELVEDAARRELLEEMGITAGKLVLWGVFSGPQTHYVYPNGDEVSCVDIVYECCDYTGTIIPDPAEVVDVGFFPPDALPQPLSPPISHVLKQYAKEIIENRRE